MPRVSTNSDRLFPGKQFISTVLDALDTKAEMTGSLRRRYLQRAAMAGMIVAIFYATNFSLVAVFAAIDVGGTALNHVGRVAGALAFGWALVFIYYTKSELLTSNMMIVCIGAYYKKITWGRGLKLLVLCLIGNFLGGLLMAALMKYSTLAGGDTGLQLHLAVEHKLAYISAGPTGWVDLFVRAILCNFMINLAMLLIYNGYLHDDISKVLTMITSVFVFAYLSFEHSVANTVLFTMVGLRDGINLGEAFANVGIVLIGNFVGGGLLIGMYYAYVNDDTSYKREHPEAM